MRLFECKKRPKAFGSVALTFGHRTDPPRLRGKTICLPDDPMMEIFLLDSGRQFLSNWTGPQHLSSTIWFGGEENDGKSKAPFLWKIKKVAFSILAQYGEAGLREALVPPIIKWAIEEWGNHPTMRQGQLYAYSLPATWEEDFPEIGWHIRKGMIEYGEPFRFKLKGRYTRHPKTKQEGHILDHAPPTNGFVGEGVIDMPGYRPWILEGPCLIERTSLFDSRETTG